jgi:putative membrane protein
MIRISRAILIAAGCAGALALVPTGCGSDDNTQADGSVKPGGGGDGSTGASSLNDAGPVADALVKLSDNATAGVLMEANTGEIMAGNVATGRAQNAMVKAYAQQMVTEHSTSNQRLMALLPKLGAGNGDSLLRQTVSTSSSVTLTKIATAQAVAFDATYMASQVEVHQMVLKMIDDVLIPSAQNAELKTELTGTRAAVMMHLTAAQTLSASVGGSGS